MSDTAYILKYQAYMENRFMAKIISRKHGKTTIFLPKKYPPRYLYKYSITWQEDKKLKPLEIIPEHIHNLKGPSMLASYYVLEWMLTFATEHTQDFLLFDIFEETLNKLENAYLKNDIEKILRTYERKSLDYLGYGLNSTQLEFVDFPYISYDPLSGYKGHHVQESSTCICLSRKQIHDILTDNYDNSESLHIAKTFIQKIVRSLLPHHVWQCKQLYHK